MSDTMLNSLQISSIRWEIEPKCNLNCKHCFVGSKLDSFQELDLDSAMKIVNKIASIGVKKVNFTTKEPTLFKELDKLIFYCSLKGIYTELVTNGVLLRDITLSEKIVNSGVGAINISMEGISDTSNDYIRGKGTFVQILKALNNLKNVMEPGRYVPIVIQMTLNRKNKLEVHKIPAFFNSLPVDMVVIGGLLLEGNARENPDIALSSEEFLEAWEIILEEYLSLDYKRYYLNSKSLFPPEAVYYNIMYGTDLCPLPPRCGVLNGNFSLLPNGCIIPCVAILDKEANVGRLPMIDLLNKEFIEEKDKKRMDDFINSVSELIKLRKPYICSQCYYEDWCMPCPVSLLQKGFLDEISERCERALKELEMFLLNIQKAFKEYYVVVSQDTLMHLEKDKAFLTRFYRLGETLQRKYKVDGYKARILKSIFDNGAIALPDLCSDLSVTSADVLNFLKPLFYDGFIEFRRSERVPFYASK
ncbi:radical SAM protein [Kosmotoga sp. DU53]|nr:radical SAM protein [Kosmotoga sp. DU53]